MKRHLVPFDGDTLSDIGHIPFSDFWKKCEDLLPDDWAMQLIVKQHEGFPIYAAMAFLDDDAQLNPAAVRGTRWCSTPERAIEILYYMMRDGMLDQEGMLKSLDLRQP